GLVVVVGGGGDELPHAPHLVGQQVRAGRTVVQFRPVRFGDGAGEVVEDFEHARPEAGQRVVHAKLLVHIVADIGVAECRLEPVVEVDRRSVVGGHGCYSGCEWLWMICSFRSRWSLFSWDGCRAGVFALVLLSWR